MTSSWKIGAIAGFIAGIVSGIGAFVHGLSVLSIPALGLIYWGLEGLTPLVISRVLFVEIALGIVWWIAAGLIYVKIYDLIPGKGIWKGLVYSLGIYFIFCVRLATHEFFYGRIISGTQLLLYIYSFILAGLVFGVTYEFLSKKYSITKYESKEYKYDLVKGIYPGAVAGLVMGVVIFVYLFLIYNPIEYSRFAEDIGFLLSQLGTHLFFNMIWCSLFGVLFVRFYERIPGKGVLKGVIFSMVLFFFTTFHSAIYSLAYGKIVGFILSLAGIPGFLAFGIVIGLLYRKPTETPSIEKEDTQVFKIVKCIHCNATITKGSEYCSKCGKKQ